MRLNTSPDNRAIMRLNTSSDNRAIMRLNTSPDNSEIMRLNTFHITYYNIGKIMYINLS